MSYPLIGQRLEPGGKFSTQECSEIILQMFRLPPFLGMPQDQLPQSLEECHRGLHHINWHKVTYFQGTLTQNGGDCLPACLASPLATASSNQEQISHEEIQRRLGTRGKQDQETL